MSSDLLEETKKIRQQLEQGIAEAEDSINKSKEYLGRQGYDLNSEDLKNMLDHSSDPKIKQKYEEYQEELQREIDQEQSRLQQLNSGSASDGTPHRKPVSGVKI